MYQTQQGCQVEGGPSGYERLTVILPDSVL